MSSFFRRSVRPRINTRAIVGLLAVAVLGAGCSGKSGGQSTGQPASAKLNVVATTVQITALAKEVGGDKIDLHGIMPAGADPHEFEPRPSDLVTIEGAQVILRHGMGLDSWLDGTLEAGANAQVVTVTDGVSPIEAEEGGKQVDDPHVWHDPANDTIMVDNIAAALEQADPANSATYRVNAAAYDKVLDNTKAQVQTIIDEIPAGSRKLVTDHDAFGYFAQAFGLEIVGAVIPSVATDAQSSAQQTAALLDTIRQEHVKAIFSEQSANPKLARTLAADANVKTVDDLYGDSLGGPGSGADTVDGMLLYNARKIADALKS